MHQGKCVGCGNTAMVNDYYPTGMEITLGIRRGAYCARCYESLEQTRGYPATRKGVREYYNPSQENAVRDLEDY